MAEYRLSPRAQRDMEAIFDYTVERWGLAQALRYIDLIETACVSLVQAPHLSQDCSLIRPGYRRRSAGQHSLYFRQTHYGIAVIRILHQRMDAARYI